MLLDNREHRNEISYSLLDNVNMNIDEGKDISNISE